MSTQPPAIPPRPSRSPQQQQQQQQQAPPPTSTSDIPKIPPRPNRRAERSMSPLHHNYAPSPFNEKPGGLSVSRTTSNDQLQRPPSVTIPSLGQEGIEYEDLNVGNTSDNGHPSPAETRNVGSDLKLHAPRPSLPTTSAKAKVAAVTRTDSRQAAEAGFGAGTVATPASEEPQERFSRSLHSKAGDSRAQSSAALSDRRQSSHLEEEHGIPEIGQRVPINPFAGDVQAPSPSPHSLDDGLQRSGRSQHRARGSRDVSLPPGSYGLHGHGVNPNDKFEKAWFQKHPDEYAKEEQGQHGPALVTPRPDSALSSADLNKIVRGSAILGSGMGTSPAVTGTPEEEVGYIASDEYTHRMASPAPDRSARPTFESPLRKMSHPTKEIESKQENGAEDSGVIHVDDPYHSAHHPDGFARSPAPEEMLHKPAEGEGDEEETILAADEVRPESAFQHPAVSPMLERGDSFDHDTKSQTSSASHSRASSRPSSLHCRPTLARYASRGEEREDINTPLEDVDEYEPLFPEDDNKEKKPVSTTERFKQRPDTLKHKFPSEDIWEDTPSSLQLHATVTTPDLPKNELSETPEEESFRRSQAASVDPHKVATNILESEDQPGQDQKRPSLSKQRFPSKDVWEDAPDSQQLVTTVGAPQEAPASKSPELPRKPSIPSRPQKRPSVETSTKPSADNSTKPAASPEKRQPPSIPNRPKPQVPARTAKWSPEEQKEQKETPPVKSKPPVPSRPGGSKIAALKAGFLSDLNSRLQVGPQGPKPPEKEEEPPAEKKPLQDARKGRARGPARRKPAPAPAPTPALAETAGAKPATVPEVKITETWNIWQVDDEGKLVVNGDKGRDGADKNEAKPAQPDVIPMAPELSKNAIGEPTDPQPAPTLPKAEEEKPNVGANRPESNIEPAVEPATKPEESRTALDVALAQPEPKPEPATSTEPATRTESIIKAEPAVQSGEPPVPTEPAVQTEPTTVIQHDIIPPGDAANNFDGSASALKTPESKLDEVAENMAASADGKRPSDGDFVHV